MRDSQVSGCGDQIAGTTVGGSTAFNWYSCLNQSTEDGPEIGYQVVVPASVQITVNMTIQGNNDLDLFLLPNSNGTCDVNACIDASLNYNNNAESLTFNMPAGGAFLVVDTWDTPGPFSLTITCDQDVENCTNGIDDNGNGQVDCSDAECANHPSCQQVPKDCTNGTDDDGDGLSDCDDPDCATHPACQQAGGDGGTTPDPDGSIGPESDGGSPDPDPDYDPGFDRVSGGCTTAPGPAVPVPTALAVLALLALLGLAVTTRKRG